MGTRSLTSAKQSPMLLQHGTRDRKAKEVEKVSANEASTQRG